jgi:hypothetical protein
MYCAEKTIEQVGPKSGLQTPDESKDELAIRLRTEGYTFREIGERMGVDASMAHRRTKRAMMRRRCEMEDRMEDVRDLEFEKLRIAERALMPQVAEGDQNAIRLLLRIIDTRKRYLKDLPYKNADEDPWADLMDDETLNGEEDDNAIAKVAEEEQAEVEAADAQEEEPLTHEEALAQQDRMIEAMQVATREKLEPGSLEEHFMQEMIEEQIQERVAMQEEASTTASTNPSTKGSTNPSTTASTDSSRKTANDSMLGRKGAKSQRKKEEVEKEKREERMV